VADLGKVCVAVLLVVLGLLDGRHLLLDQTGQRLKFRTTKKKRGKGEEKKIRRQKKTEEDRRRRRQKKTEEDRRRGRRQKKTEGRM
jgi:hypothetical protein